jgi:hypothetical protein
MAQAWISVEAALPQEWRLMGVVRGPRGADPQIRGDGWVAWAKGPHGLERVEGRGDSVEQALGDLANRLRTLA